jgi:hypothetical protein
LSRNDFLLYRQLFPSLGLQFFGFPGKWVIRPIVACIFRVLARAGRHAIRAAKNNQRRAGA